MMYKISLTALLVISFSVLKAQEEKTAFEPSGKVFGEVFGDYAYKVGSSEVDSLLDGVGEYKKLAKNDNVFGLRRFYLGYTHEFSENISAKLMFEGNDGNLINSKSKRGVNVKYYYLKWGILPNADLIIGGQSTPTWSRFTEKIWSYRSVEKTIMDFRKQGISNDLGVSLAGKLADGVIGYNLMVGNGTAQKLEFNQNKKIYGSVNAKLINEKLLLEFYFDNERDDNDKALTTIKGFIGFQNDLLTIGVEPFQKSYYIENTKVRTYGTTVFARGQLIESRLNAFARYDAFGDDMSNNEIVSLSMTNDINCAYKENFYLIGLDYTPVKGVSIMPNIWINSYNVKDNSQFPDKDADVVTRVTFRYKFK